MMLNSLFSEKTKNTSRESLLIYFNLHAYLFDFGKTFQLSSMSTSFQKAHNMPTLTSYMPICTMQLRTWLLRAKKHQGIYRDPP